MGLSRGAVQLSIILESPLVDAVDPIVSEVAQVMLKELAIMRGMFDKVTATWSKASKPVWEETFRFGITKDFTAQLATSSKIFIWQVLGTSGGRVAFSKDYQPKTRRRTIGSRAGSGKVTRRGRKAPLIKGIRAGEWHLEIADRRQLPYTRAMQKRIIIGTRKFFRGTKVRVIAI